MKNFRDIERLSSFLDGQLSPADSARLEARLATDPELASAFNDLRAARGILRKLPSRKAPRNFTLTRQMVGLKPPLPRSYSFFRLSTAFATILLTLTFAVNLVTPRLSYVGPINTGWGGGYGGGPAAPALMEALPATEAPLAAPAAEMMPQPTLTADSVATELPTAKGMATPSELLDQPPALSQPSAAAPLETQSRTQSQPPIPFIWQMILLAAGILSGLTAFLLRRSASQKWK